MPRPPPDTPVSAATGGIGLVSMRPDGARCATEPVTSERVALSEPNMSENRPESVQLAAPNPINEMATTCGHRADRRDAHMVTRSQATNARSTKQQCGKQAFKRLNKISTVAKWLQFAR